MASYHDSASDVSQDAIRTSNISAITDSKSNATLTTNEALNTDLVAGKSLGVAEKVKVFLMTTGDRYQQYFMQANSKQI